MATRQDVDDVIANIATLTTVMTTKLTAFVDTSEAAIGACSSGGSGLLDVYYTSFVTLYNGILDAFSKVDNVNLFRRATYNYMIACNTYLTFKNMTPAPDYFVDDPPANIEGIITSSGDIAAMIAGVNATANSNFNPLVDEFFVCSANTAAFVDFTAAYVTPVTGQGKRNALEDEFDALSQRMNNVGIEFMFSVKDGAHIDITTEEKANAVYLDYGVKAFIEFHPELSLIPIYTYEIPEPE